MAPTGAGKTVVAAAGSSKSSRERLSLGSGPGASAGNHRPDQRKADSPRRPARDHYGRIRPSAEERVQVASRADVACAPRAPRCHALPPADLLIDRRVHHATAPTWRKIIDAYPDAMLLGLTATPCRGDGRGLGGIFQTMIECPQVARADRARLSGSDAGLRAGRSRPERRAHGAGDYVKAQLAERWIAPS